MVNLAPTSILGLTPLKLGERNLLLSALIGLSMPKFDGFAGFLHHVPHEQLRLLHPFGAHLQMRTDRGCLYRVSMRTNMAGACTMTHRLPVTFDWLEDQHVSYNTHEDII